MRVADAADPVALAHLERDLASARGTVSGALHAPFWEEWAAPGARRGRAGACAGRAREYFLAFGRGPDGWGFVVHCYSVRPYRLVRTTMLRDAPRAVRLAAALVVPQLVRALLRH